MQDVPTSTDLKGRLLNHLGTDEVVSAGGSGESEQATLRQPTKHPTQDSPV